MLAFFMAYQGLFFIDFCHIVKNLAVSGDRTWT